MIKALVFDFDGLILDTEGPEYEVWCRAYREQGCELTITKWSEALGTGLHFDPHDYLEELCGRTLDREGQRTIRKQRLDELMAAQTVLPGVADYLAEAKRLGLGLAVASSSTHQWVEGHLQRLDLHSHFHSFHCRDDVELTKPDPALYLNALRALGVQGHEAIALEDSPNGVRAAKRAGMFAVAVPNPLTRQLSLDEADLVIDSMANVPLSELMRQVEERLSLLQPR